MVAVAAVVALVLGGAGGFFAGYQAGGANDNAGQQGQQVGMNGGPNGMMGGGQFGMGGLGEVTAISSDSVTIKDQRQGDETTYDITSDTEVTDDGESAAVSDIAVGDTVMIRSSDDSDSDT